jgi:hypothetical protein
MQFCQNTIQPKEDKLSVISFGKAFAHVRNCLLKKAHVKNKNIDGFYAKTTQEDSARFV